MLTKVRIFWLRRRIRKIDREIRGIDWSIDHVGGGYGWTDKARYSDELEAGRELLRERAARLHRKRDKLKERIKSLC